MTRFTILSRKQIPTTFNDQRVWLITGLAIICMIPARFRLSLAVKLTFMAPPRKQVHTSLHNHQLAIVVVVIIVRNHNNLVHHIP